MCRLALDNLPIGRDEFTRHHAQAAESLSENVTLDIAIIVLACPDKPTS